MSQKKWNSAVIFPALNMQESINWYTEYLEFKCDFKWEDPVSYAVLNMEDIQVHLSLAEDLNVLKGRLYIFSPDVDKYYKRITGNGLRLSVRPEMQEYGMKDFELTDPAGNMLVIGTGAG